MATYFGVLYNTHYASVTLMTDFVKSTGSIQIAESLNKNLSPNQITKGQKIYDYDNSFYMNLLAGDFAKLKMFFKKFWTANPKQQEVIYTDQSKSRWNDQGIGTKSLTFSCMDKEKNRLVDKEGKPIIMIHVNIKYLNGQSKYYGYKCSFEDTVIIEEWINFCSGILPGLSGWTWELLKFITGKSPMEHRKEMSAKYQNQNQNQNQFGNNQSGNKYQTQNQNQSQFGNNQSASPSQFGDQSKPTSSNPESAPSNPTSPSNSTNNQYLF